MPTPPASQTPAATTEANDPGSSDDAPPQEKRARTRGHRRKGGGLKDNAAITEFVDAFAAQTHAIFSQRHARQQAATAVSPASSSRANTAPHASPPAASQETSTEDSDDADERRADEYFAQISEPEFDDDALDDEQEHADVDEGGESVSASEDGEGDEGASDGAVVLDVDRARQAAKEHMDKHKCKCKKGSCYFDGSEAIALRMRMQSQQDRMRLLQGMLFATTARPGEVNEFFKAARKRKPASNDDDGDDSSKPKAAPRAMTVYAILGRRVCMRAFVGIMQVSVRTLQRCSADIINPNGFNVHKDNRGGSASGAISIASLIATAFLDHFAASHGRICPSGRRFSNGKQVCLLEPSITQNDVFEAYKEDPPYPPDVPSAERPALLSPNGFLMVWQRRAPHIRIAKPGTDFCEYCTDMCKSKREQAWQSLEDHRRIAREERAVYKQLRDNSQKEDSTFFHGVFDFAETMLLPMPLRPPGWVYYTTGLKMDIFGFSVSNTKHHFHYALTEGHWPESKGPDCVISMVHDALGREPARSFRRHELHADNCGGQNKNNYVLQYLSLLTIVGLSDDTHLHFMIAGHTKSAPDAYFGLAKQHLRRKDVLTPDEVCSCAQRVVCGVWRLQRSHLTLVSPLPPPKRAFVFFVPCRLCAACRIPQSHQPLLSRARTCGGASGRRSLPRTLTRRCLRSRHTTTSDSAATIQAWHSAANYTARLSKLSCCCAIHQATPLCDLPQTGSTASDPAHCPRGHWRTASLRCRVEARP